MVPKLPNPPPKELTQPVVLFAVGSLVGAVVLLPFVAFDDLSGVTLSQLTPLVVLAVYATLAAVGSFRALAIVGPLPHGIFSILSRVFVVAWTCVAVAEWPTPLQALGIAVTLLGTWMFYRASAAAAAAATVVVHTVAPPTSPCTV